MSNSIDFMKLKSRTEAYEWAKMFISENGSPTGNPGLDDDSANIIANRVWDEFVKAKDQGTDVTYSGFLRAFQDSLIEIHHLMMSKESLRKKKEQLDT